MAAKKGKKTAKSAASAQQVDIPPGATEQDDELGTLIDYVKESEDLTVDSTKTSEKCRDYYDSKQLDDEERKKLTLRGQAPVVVNRCKPKVDALLGMERAAKTTAKAAPRTPVHEKGAEAATESIRFVLQNNFFDQTRSMVWENILIEGTGGAEVVVKPMKKNGKTTFMVKINYLAWNRLIYDPHSIRKDFSDSKYLGTVVWQDYDEAKAQHPGMEDILSDMIENGEKYNDIPQWMDTKRERVKIVELAYWKGSKLMYAKFTRGGFVEAPRECPYRDDDDGGYDMPFIFQSAFIDREGNRYGSLLQILDVQDEINKRRSKALHLMSVRQTFAQKGAIDDVNRFRQEMARPDGHVEYTYGEFGKDFGVLPTGDMAAAQMKLLEHATMEIDLVGANAAVQGKDKSVQSGVALRERTQSGQLEIGPLFDQLRWWQIRIYRAVWNRIKQYWDEEKWIRVTDDEQNLRWVGLNRPMTKGEHLIEMAMDNGASEEEVAQLEQQVANDPEMKTVVKTDNEIAKLDVDIILTEVPDVLTQRQEDFVAMSEMIKSGFPLPPEAVIESSPLMNKDRIIKMMKNQGPKIPPEMEKQMQKMQEENQALKEELIKMRQDNSVEMQKINAKAEADNRAIDEKTRLAEKEMAIDRAMQIDRAILEVEKLITRHEGKMSAMLNQFVAQRDAKEAAEAEAEAGVETEQDDTGQELEMAAAMQNMHKEFLGAVQQIVDSLTQKKQIVLMRDEQGRPTGATVQ